MPISFFSLLSSPQLEKFSQASLHCTREIAQKVNQVAIGQPSVINELSNLYRSRAQIYYDQSHFFFGGEKQEKLRQALQDVESALDLLARTSNESALDFCYRMRANIHLDKGEFGDALWCFHEGLQDEQLYTGAIFRARGRAYMGNQNFERAVTDLTKAIQKSGEFYWIYQDRAQVYQAQDNGFLASLDYFTTLEKATFPILLSLKDRLSILQAKFTYRDFYFEKPEEIEKGLQLLTEITEVEANLVESKLQEAKILFEKSLERNPFSYKAYELLLKTFSLFSPERWPRDQKEETDAQKKEKCEIIECWRNFQELYFAEGNFTKASEVFSQLDLLFPPEIVDSIRRQEAAYHRSLRLFYEGELLDAYLQLPNPDLTLNNRQVLVLKEKIQVAWGRRHIAQDLFQSHLKQFPLSTHPSSLEAAIELAKCYVYEKRYAALSLPLYPILTESLLENILEAPYYDVESCLGLVEILIALLESSSALRGALFANRHLEEKAAFEKIKFFDEKILPLLRDTLIPSLIQALERRGTPTLKATFLLAKLCTKMCDLHPESPIHAVRKARDKREQLVKKKPPLSIDSYLCVEQLLLDVELALKDEQVERQRRASTRRESLYEESYQQRRRDLFGDVLEKTEGILRFLEPRMEELNEERQTRTHFPPLSQEQLTVLKGVFTTQLGKTFLFRGIIQEKRGNWEEALQAYQQAGSFGVAVQDRIEAAEQRRSFADQEEFFSHEQSTDLRVALNPQNNLEERILQCKQALENAPYHARLHYELAKLYEAKALSFSTPCLEEVWADWVDSLSEHCRYPWSLCQMQLKEFGLTMDDKKSCVLLEEIVCRNFSLVSYSEESDFQVLPLLTKKWQRLKVRLSDYGILVKDRNAEYSWSDSYNIWGFCLERRALFEKALFAYQMALELNPSNQLIKSNLDRVRVKLQDCEEALQSYQQAQRYGNASSAAQRVNLYLKLGRYLSAKDLAAEFSVDHSNFTNYNTVITKEGSYFQKHVSQSAFNLASPLFTLHAKCDKELRTREYVLQELERLEQALEGSLSETTLQARKNLISIQKVALSWKEKIEAKLNPNYLICLAHVYEKNGQYEEAIKLYEMVLFVRPHHPHAFFQLVSLIRSLRMEYEKLREYETIIEGDRMFQYTYAVSAELLARVGEKKDQERTLGFFLKALHYAPTNSWLYERTAAFAHKNFSLSQLEQALKESPDFSYALVVKAFYFLALEDKEKALAHFKKAQEELPEEGLQKMVSLYIDDLTKGDSCVLL